SPRHTGQVLWFGGSPKRAEQAQKILDCVFSWACVSIPMTGSKRSRISGARPVAVAFGRLMERDDYSIGPRAARGPGVGKPGTACRRPILRCALPSSLM